LLTHIFRISAAASPEITHYPNLFTGPLRWSISTNKKAGFLFHDSKFDTKKAKHKTGAFDLFFG
jgi:hypothetical protein